MFDWEEFKNGEIAVHCDTEEKADDFLKECEKRNIKWIGGDNATHHNHYSVNFGLTCYCGKKGVLSYSDKVYFIQKGTTIVKWEVKEVKERTFKEVIANIKEGQVWGAYDKKIIRTSTGIIFENFGSYFEIGDHFTFKLQRKEYNFEEAFKALEEGKEIESTESHAKYKKIDDCYKTSIIIGEWNFAGCLLNFHEIKGKWYINEVD